MNLDVGKEVIPPGDDEICGRALPDARQSGACCKYHERINNEPGNVPAGPCQDDCFRVGGRDLAAQDDDNWRWPQVPNQPARLRPFG